MNTNRKGEGEIVILVYIAIGAVILLGGIGGCMAIKPNYEVWQQEKEGMAALAKAESTRRIIVLESQAKLDSSKNLAAAEIERAKGVAEANRIIGKSLEGNEAYLHYLWINNLHEGRNDVIYVPTEAGIPLMEAGRAVAKPRRPSDIER